MPSLIFEIESLYIVQNSLKLILYLREVFIMSWWPHFLTYNLQIFSPLLKTAHYFAACYTEVFRFGLVSFGYLYFCCLCFWCQTHEIITKSNIMMSPSKVCFVSFIVSSLIAMSSLHFQLIFVHGMRGVPGSSYPAYDVQLPQKRLLEGLSFPTV